MEEKDCGDNVPPEERSPSAEEENGRGKKGRGHPVKAIQPAQLGKLAEVLDEAPIVGVIFVGDDPADMRPPEAALPGRVDVALVIRVAVMIAVVCRPPENTLLR